jgi:hypothetical protein
LLTYSYSYKRIQSCIPIPELPQSAATECDFVFIIESQLKQVISFHKSYHWLSPELDPVLSYCKQDSFHWLQFPGHADFRVSLDARNITCYPAQGVTHETVRHFLLDQVLPRCMAYQGEIILHASAVNFKDSAIIFLGNSGTGKSTLAGNFHQAGQPVVSDDCLLIQESGMSFQAVSTYRGLRLWDDSLEILFPSGSKIEPMPGYSEKKRILLDAPESSTLKNGLPVAAMFILCPPQNNPGVDVLLERISRREVFIALMKQSFHLDVFDTKRMECHMQVLGRIISGLPAFRLVLRHDYGLLPLARQKIVEAVSKISS